MARIDIENVTKRYRTAEKGLSFVSHLDRFNRFRWFGSAGDLPQGAPSKGNVSFSIEKLSLSVEDGKVCVILGPSGCGKTTLLKMIAGLDAPDEGEILFDGVSVNEIEPKARGIGMIFQNYALYPHMTARNNIASWFFFRKKDPELDETAKEKFRQTSELLGVKMSDLLDRRVGNLSGGEKQRVALGRCITRDPKVFLMDEPFSNLDQHLREKYRIHLKTLLKRFGITTVYVTHDQQEALILADEVVIMNCGSIAQKGTPDQLYAFPESIFVSEFLNWEQDTPAINFLNPSLLKAEGSGLVAGIRPEDIEVCGRNDAAAFPAAVIDVRHVPVRRSSIVTLGAGDDTLVIRTGIDESVKPGSMLYVRPKRYHLFDRESGKRIRSVPE